MTFLNKEKHFNLLYFLSPNVRGARQEPPPRGDPGGSASSAGLGGLLYGSMGPPGVSPTLPPNASRNSILTILVFNSIQYGLELCMFIFYKFSPDFCLSGLASQWQVILLLWSTRIYTKNRSIQSLRDFYINSKTRSFIEKWKIVKDTKWNLSSHWLH